MNLFKKAKLINNNVRNCLNCNKEYIPDKRNLKRGWGLCCGKSCAATYKYKVKKSKQEQRHKRLNQLGL